MCEPHSDGGRGNSSPSEACTYNHHHPNTQPIPTHTATSTPAIFPDTTTSRPVSAPCTTSPIAPPASPPPSTCVDSQALQHHPVDLLAFRLRNQSLIPPPNSSSQRPTTSAALSPASLCSDDFVPPFIVPDDTDSMAMQVDNADDDLAALLRSRFQHRTYRYKSTAAGPSSSSESSGALQPAPEVNDSFPVAEPGLSSTGQTLYGPDLDMICPAIEVDEGYCEENDDRSWLESVMSVRQTDSAGGISKRYGLSYRTSNEAASRCKNAVHSVPRMRRRDKKRRKRFESDLSKSGMGAAVAASQ